MGIFTKLLIAGAIGLGVNSLCKSVAEEKKRKSTPCLFEDGISEDEFQVIVKKEAKAIKRIVSTTFDGPIVYCQVRSQSGISDWYFSLDFNDYGHITGLYWISSDNDDSSVPKVLADRISTHIDAFLDEV